MSEKKPPQSTNLRTPALLSPKLQKQLQRKGTGNPRTIVVYYLKNYPVTVAASLVTLLIAGLLESFGLAALLPILGQLTGGKAKLPSFLDGCLRSVFGWVGMEPNIEVLLIVVMGLLLAKIAMNFIVLVFVGSVQARVTGELRNSLVTSLANARWSYFTGQVSGRTANTLLSEVAKSAGGLTAICQLLAALTQVLVFAVMASLISWRVTLIALLASLVSAGLLSRLIRLLRRNQRERIIASANMTARLVDGLSNMKTLKAMNAERHMTKLIARDIASIRRNTNIGVALNEGITSLQELVKLLALLGAFFFLFMVASQPLELILVVLVLFMRVMQSATSVQNKYKALVTCEAPFEHVQAFIKKAAAEAEDRSGAKEPSLTRSIRIDGVSFAYERELILDNVTLEIPTGSLVCLSGPSGSGKTTLLDIICGLLKPQKGDVLLDNVQLREINLRRWRRQIGYVPQELILFHDTLLANVTLGDDKIPSADVEQALRAAGAWSFVEKLPEGLDTLVGERGMRFSGGQRQRISIARALVRRPRLLILDEATASLDPATEKEFCKTLAGLRGRVTMLAATHQAALNQYADAVYRIRNGHLDQMSPQLASASSGLGVDERPSVGPL